MRLLTASSTDDSGFKRARSIAVVKAAARSTAGSRGRRRSPAQRETS